MVPDQRRHDPGRAPARTLLLFDIDGTLVLTGGAGARAMVRAFEEVFGFFNGLGTLSMAGPLRAVQPLADTGNGNAGRKARRVHFLDRRRPKQVAAGLGQHPCVGRFPARIAVQILVRRELFRIDKDRGDNPVRAAPRFLDQRHMARVQGAHCRHQRDPIALCAECRDGVTKRD